MSDAENYRELIWLLRRTHGRFHDLFHAFLGENDYRDLTPQQAFLLYNLLDRVTTTGAARRNGYYIGTNISHNVNKLEDAGYLSRKHDPADGRSVLLSLTDKGREVAKLIAKELDRQAPMIVGNTTISAADLETAKKALMHLERFWLDALAYRL